MSEPGKSYTVSGDGQCFTWHCTCPAFMTGAPVGPPEIAPPPRRTAERTPPDIQSSPEPAPAPPSKRGGPPAVVTDAELARLLLRLGAPMAARRPASSNPLAYLAQK